MENIFKDAYFGKPYKTRDGRKAIYLGDNTCWIEGGETEIGYSRNGRFVEYQEHGIDIVSEWKEEISEEEYENKIKSLIDSCTYWEACEDKPELFAKHFKELLDFASEDKRTIDYCAYLIKSKKTILNEIYSHFTLFKIDEKELDDLAYRWAYNTSGTYVKWELLQDAYKAGYRKALENETKNC